MDTGQRGSETFHPPPLSERVQAEAHSPARRRAGSGDLFLLSLPAVVRGDPRGARLRRQARGRGGGGRPRARRPVHIAVMSGLVMSWSARQLIDPIIGLILAGPVVEGHMGYFTVWVGDIHEAGPCPIREMIR